MTSLQAVRGLWPLGPLPLASCWSTFTTTPERRPGAPGLQAPHGEDPGHEPLQGAPEEHAEKDLTDIDAPEAAAHPHVELGAADGQARLPRSGPVVGLHRARLEEAALAGAGELVCEHVGVQPSQVHP